ncbi:MAG: UbiD family decarboxylase [Betaproteobacteria bacterium]
MDQSFRSHLQALDDEGELIRFTKEVDPLNNMSAIEWKAYNELGKSSLFSNIAHHPQWRACSQILADRKKWSLGLGIASNELLQTISKRLRHPIASTAVDASIAPVKEVVELSSQANLESLPSMKVSELDSGRFIASGIAFLKDPETGIGNLSFHRMQIKGPQQTGFIMLQRHARRIYDKYSALGQATPVSIAIGVHPAIFFASGYTTQFGLDELSLAGALLGESIRTVKSQTNDIQVPAEAEIILEGELVPNNHLEPEGPFGEVTGNYPDAGVAHVFKLKAITRRKDAIFYALHCGFPTTDTQATTGLGIEIATYEHLERVDGGLDLLDVRCLTVSGLFVLVIKIRPKVEGQAKVALMAALSGPYQQPKIAIAIDEDIDADDLRQLIWSIATRVDASKDLILIPNVKVWGLDNASDVVPGVESFQRVGTRWMIDATKPPLTRSKDRARFSKALPPNFNSVNLKDFLP